MDAAIALGALRVTANVMTSKLPASTIARSGALLLLRRMLKVVAVPAGRVAGLLSAHAGLVPALLRGCHTSAPRADEKERKVVTLCLLLLQDVVGMPAYMAAYAPNAADITNSIMDALPIMTAFPPGETRECCICREGDVDADGVATLDAHGVVYTPCFHVYHGRCIRQWVCQKADTCPMCTSRVLATIQRQMLQKA